MSDETESTPTESTPTESTPILGDTVTVKLRADAPYGGVILSAGKVTRSESQVIPKAEFESNELEYGLEIVNELVEAKEDTEVTE